MPLTVGSESRVADRLRTAIRIRKQIDELERRFVRIVANVPKHMLTRNVYGFSAGEMKKIAQKLHAKAKKGVASGRGKEFCGSIDEAL